jgi:hypothetical protein
MILDFFKIKEKNNSKITQGITGAMNFFRRDLPAKQVPMPEAK